MTYRLSVHLQLHSLTNHLIAHFSYENMFLLLPMPSCTRKQEGEAGGEGGGIDLA